MAGAKPQGPVIPYITFHPRFVSPKSVPRTPRAQAACQSVNPSPYSLLPPSHVPQSMAATLKQGTKKKKKKAGSTQVLTYLRRNQ